MVRINLLPPEITEKRKFEQNIMYVAIVAVVVLVFLGIVYTFLVWQESGQNEILQQNKESAAQLLDQAQAYEVFQDKEDVLGQRLDVASEALADRVDWGRLANEMSLVLPTDIWLTYLSGSESEGLEIAGHAIDSEADVPDVGHKAVAKMLVRLAELEQLESVWLTSSTKVELTGTKRRVIEFTMITGITNTAATTTQTASVPAPPNQSAP